MARKGQDHRALTPARTAMTLRAMTREKRIMELRIGGATYKEIGEKIAEDEQLAQPLSPGRVSTIVKKALDRITVGLKTEAEHYRAIELLRLDKLQKSIWNDATSETTERQDRKLRSIDRILSIMQRRANLLGLDKPQKHELDITDGRTAEDLSDDELAQVIVKAKMDAAKNVTPALPAHVDVEADLVEEGQSESDEDVARLLTEEEQKEAGLDTTGDDPIDNDPSWLEGANEF